MKKSVFLVAVFIAVVFCAHSQSQSDKMYDAFADRDGITNVSFSKNMLDAVNLDIGDEGEERKVKGDLHQVRFMAYNPKKGTLSGLEFIKEAIGYLPKFNYKKYEEKGDDDNDAEIWLMGGKKKFEECHIFIKNENSTGLQFIVSFYGDFRVEDIDKLRKTGKGFAEN